MPVTFGHLKFHNQNNIDVTLSVQAPIGNAIGTPQTVPAKESVTINPAVMNCASVLLMAAEGHGDYDQAFGTLPVNHGRASYLERLEVVYRVASFEGTFTALTEQNDD